jgi:hypothetical protein
VKVANLVQISIGKVRARGEPALSPFGCAQGKLRRMGGYLWSLAYRQVDVLKSFLSEVWHCVLSKSFVLAPPCLLPAPAFAQAQLSQRSKGSNASTGALQ